MANARALLYVNDQPAKTFKVAVYSCQSSSKWQLHLDDYYYYYKLVDVLLLSTRVIDSVYIHDVEVKLANAKKKKYTKRKGRSSRRRRPRPKRQKRLNVKNSFP